LFALFLKEIGGRDAMWYQGSAKESLCTTEVSHAYPIIYLDEYMRYHIADLFRQYFLKPQYLDNKS
jgi:hypothetical protein